MRKKSSIIYPEMTNDEEINALSKILEFMGINHIKKLVIDRKTDIDIFAFYYNLLIFIECAGKRDKINKKIRVAKDIFDEIGRNPKLLSNALDRYLKENEVLPDVKRYIIRLIQKINNGEFNSYTLRKILITTRRIPSQNKKIENLHVFDFDNLKYFEILSKITRKHSRYELFIILGLTPQDIGERIPLLEGTVRTAQLVDTSEKKDIIIFTDYPYDLIRITHVLRIYSPIEGFQRLLLENKITRMMKYLKERKIVYPNNIIVSAPISHFNSYDPGNDKNIVRLSFKSSYDLFARIDGQHRLYSFAYPDSEIEDLAKEKKIIVTAIIYKEGVNWLDESAKLFFEINTTYTILNPEEEIDLKTKLYKDEYNPETFANNFLKELNKLYPLKNMIKVGPFDEDYYKKPLLKRVSIIRYGGLKEIFNSSSKTFKKIYKKIFINSTFKVSSDFNWKEYFNFCIWMFTVYFKSIKEVLSMIKGKELTEKIWNDTGKEEFYFMSVTVISSFIRLLRHFLSPNNEVTSNIREIIHDTELTDNDRELKLKKEFEKYLKLVFEKFSFKVKEWKKLGYKSSQWALLERDMLKTIRTHHHNFGDLSLLPKKYRHEFE